MSDEPKPSGTVALIRDTRSGLEVLLLERAQRKGSGSGPSVFPGGKVEGADLASAPDAAEAARRAAVRETEEEAGILLTADQLVPISRWITPELAPRRFDTWFFLASVGIHEEVRVDGGEIGGHRWLSPADALEAHHRDEIRLAPPTFVTVHWLVEHGEAAAALEALGREDFLTIRPRICGIPPKGACILYPGDAGYEAGDMERPGARHRLWALPGAWRYECTTRGPSAAS